MSVLGRDRSTPSYEIQGLSARHVFHVEKSPSSLATQLETAIRAGIAETPHVSPLAGDVAKVNYRLVDDLIKKDFEASGMGYTVYILNPPKQPVEYLYFEPGDLESHRAEAQEVGKPKDKGAPRSMARCGFNIHPGVEHYLWVDLTAGPLVCGPATSGEGLVLSQTLPVLANYVNPATGAVKVEELLPALATFISRVAEHLVTPAFDRFPVPFAPAVEVRLHVIHDYPKDEYAKKRAAVDWDAVTRQLMRLALPGQHISATQEVRTFRSCEACVAALTHSLKSHNSNVVRGGLRTQVHQYIDSAELNSWLDHYSEAFDAPARGGVAVLPVFLFDLDRKSTVFLDRFHQAVAFDRRVVAVTTSAGRPVTDLMCNGKPVAVDAGDATRPVLAALLQAGWGVAPTQLRYGGRPGSENVEFHAFSLSNTPFGPYAHSHRSLSFSQADAAPRNMLITSLHEIVSSAAAAEARFHSQYTVSLDTALTAEEMGLYTETRKQLEVQLQKASLYLSLHNFPQCLFHINAARPDAESLATLLAKAGSRLTGEVRHAAVPASSSLPDIIAFAVLALALLGLYRELIGSSSASAGGGGQNFRKSD